MRTQAERYPGRALPRPFQPVTPWENLIESQNDRWRIVGKSIRRLWIPPDQEKMMYCSLLPFFHLEMNTVNFRNMT